MVILNDCSPLGTISRKFILKRRDGFDDCTERERVMADWPTSIYYATSYVGAIVKIVSGTGGRTIDEKTMTRRWQGLNVVEEDICLRHIRKKYTRRSLYNQGGRVHHLFVITISFLRFIIISSHHLFIPVLSI